MHCRAEAAPLTAGGPWTWSVKLMMSAPEGRTDMPFRLSHFYVVISVCDVRRVCTYERLTFDYQSFSVPGYNVVLAPPIGASGIRWQFRSDQGAI
jgi:hypothetical protein